MDRKNLANGPGGCDCSGCDGAGGEVGTTGAGRVLDEKVLGVRAAALIAIAGRTATYGLPKRSVWEF